MNRIDKLLTLARHSNKLTYHLTTIIIPQDNGKYDFRMSLYKGGNMIASHEQTFDTEEDMTSFIDEVRKQYNLTENNTKVVNFWFVAATEEDAKECNNCEVI